MMFGGGSYDWPWTRLHCRPVSWLREPLQALTDRALVTRCAGLRPGPLDTPVASGKHTLRSLARRWLTLADEITTHDLHLARLTAETSPTLREGFAVGANTAAAMLIIFGDNPERTVKRILHDHGLAPAPERNPRTPWKTFLQTHWEGLAAADLFTVEVRTLAGLRRYFVFFVIELKTRRVHITGIHPPPDGRWMEQLARNLTDPVDGFLRTVRQLIHDCDPLYTRVCGEILTSGDVGPIRLPPKSPNLNAYAERFVRSIKEECLHRVVPLGEGHVRFIGHEYVEHDQRERNHQGLDNQLLQRPPPPVRADADVQRRERLGGLLSFYYREAA